ncbi:hypothetical protein [uncultured Polaribacter sp.]|uniref:hypothetical protein n=1 Tax=uncultured Polaribacter sp. TaxID=174711 RepID=UPI0026026F85|nr:hypothetical protein [uncultured Polaribacter sp.]
MKKTTQIALAIALLLLLFLFKDWIRHAIITSLGGYTTKETQTITKTEYRQGIIDTLEIFNHYVTTKGITLNPEPKIVYVTRKVGTQTPITTPKESVPIDSVKQFEVQVKDSLLDGRFTIYNKFNGDLLSSEFSYKPLFPKYLLRVDTLRITTTKTETLTRTRSKFGLGLGFDTQSRLQILGSYTTKNNWQFVYEFEVPSGISSTTGIQQPVHGIKVLKGF